MRMNEEAASRLVPPRRPARCKPAVQADSTAHGNPSAAPVASFEEARRHRRARLDAVLVREAAGYQVAEARSWGDRGPRGAA